VNPENGLSETLYFPDQALKNIMRDAVFFFIMMRDLRRTTWGPVSPARDNNYRQERVAS